MICVLFLKQGRGFVILIKKFRIREFALNTSDLQARRLYILVNTIRHRWKCFFSVWIVPIGGFFLGCLVFLILYGINPLRITGSNWIFNGVIEMDILQHHAGWMFFRDSNWTWPLGVAQNMGYPIGANIAFTDSIPLVSIFFKLFSGFLPEKFQFLGLYTLLSFGLQGSGAAVLIRIFTREKRIAILGCIPFIFSSCMLERAFRHTALASHWLILFAFALFFKQRKDPKPLWFWLFGCLITLAIGIHPYLFVMVLCLFVCTSLSSLLEKNERGLTKKKILSLSFINLCFPLIAGGAIGVLSAGQIRPASGFGEYSLNLNQFINPTAKGIDRWSLFMKKLPQITGQEDGLYYVGAGIIIFTIGILSFLIYKLFSGGNIKNRCRNFFRYLYSYRVLLGMCAGLFLFSLSNLITVNERIIFSYPLPQFILSLCNIFRSSGRFFTVIYYLWFLWVIVGIIRLSPRHKKTLLLCLVLIQIIDIYPGLAYKYNYFRQDFERPWLNPIWDETGKRYSKMIVLGENRDLQLAGWIAEHHLKTNMMFSAAIHLHQFWEETATEREALLEHIIAGGILEKDTVYIFDNQAWLPAIREGLNPLYEIIQTDNYYRIYYLILPKETS